MKKMVAGLIIQDKRLLLVHNTKHTALRIEPPGGKKEDSETLKQALVREISEEIGVQVKVGKLFGVFSTTSPEGNFAVHTYFCEIITGQPRLKEPETISAFVWYRLHEIKLLAKEGKLVPNLMKSLDELRKFL